MKPRYVRGPNGTPAAPLSCVLAVPLNPVATSYCQSADRGPQELYVLGGASAPLVGGFDALAMPPPYLAKINTSTMEEVWKVDLSSTPLQFRWVLCPSLPVKQRGCGLHMSVQEQV